VRQPCEQRSIDIGSSYMAISCLRLCLSERKRLEEWTPKLVHVRFHDRPMAALTLWSKGQIRLGYGYDCLQCFDAVGWAAGREVPVKN